MPRRLALTLLLLGLAAAPAQAAPHLIATPRTTLLDQTVRIRVTGLRPGERVTISATEDALRARGVYRADGSGVVDVARTPSTAGSYVGRSAMGLFWSMDPIGKPRQAGTAETVRFAATVGRGTIATATVVRRLAARGIVGRDTTLAADGFVGRYFAPRGRGPFTPVLLFGGSEGGLGRTVTSGLLASHGYAALAIAYFGAPGLPHDLVRIPLEYFARAIRWLDRQPGVDPSRLVVSGVSRGAEAALLLGADFPQLVHGVVALDPTSIVHLGWPLKAAEAGAPAWTLDGRPVEPAPIPVERISGPVFLAAGVSDQVWPSYSFEEDVVARLKAHGKTDVTALAYPDAGHGIGLALPNIPALTVASTPYGELDLGGTRSADAAARADLWPRMLRFLARA